MKILWNDLAKLSTTTVSGLYPAPGYPASNVVDSFLDRTYISAIGNDAVTIDLGSNMPISSVFVAGLNADRFDLLIQSAALVTLVSQAVVDASRFVNPVHFDQVSGRYITITADTADGIAPWVDQSIDDGTYLKIRGIGCGVCAEMPYNMTNDFGLPRIMATDYSVSKTGQYLATNFEQLRERVWNFVDIEYADFKAVESGIIQLGLMNPTYIDGFEDTAGFDDPMYAVIYDVLQPVRRGQNFDFALKIREAR